METRTPINGPEQPTSSRARLSLMGERMRMKAPKVPIMKGMGGAGMKIGQGHVQVVPPGYQVMAHLVGAQDQEQGERKRDALREQFGGFQGIDPLLQGPGDDGGDHRGQEQPQVQQAARRLGGRRQGGTNSASRQGSGIISGGRRSLLRAHFRSTPAFKAAISRPVTSRKAPRCSPSNLSGPKAMRFNFSTGCPTCSISRLIRW